MQPTRGNGKICYIEIPTADIGRSASFYRNVFGWQIRKRGDGQTAFDDGVGEVSGAWVSGRPASPTPGLLMYVMVDDVEATIRAIVENGGEIVQPLGVDAPEITARFRDPGGNVLGLYQEPAARVTSGHAPVNGISMYYELHGRKDGVPLVLLHGGGSTIEVTFGRVLPVLARGRRVIAVEEQGHGRTSDRDAPVAFESSADDVAALLRHLKVEQADILGFSNGASIALQVAIRHPQLVRKLVFASSFTKRGGARPELWGFIEKADFSNMPQPLKDAFLRVNPDVRQLKSMHDKDAARMQNFKDVPDDLVRSVRAPTLIVLGDRDIVNPEHAVELTRLIQGARLLILPGGHGDFLGEIVTTQTETRYPELTAGLIEEFLDQIP